MYLSVLHAGSAECGLEYSQNKPTYGEIEVKTIFDTVRDHYQILHLG